MKKSILGAYISAFLLFGATPMMAQFNIGKAAEGATKVLKAATLTDADMAKYVKEYVAWMDEHNHVCDARSPYTKRLNRLTQGLKDIEGIPLNFKVYYVTDVNAFACPDGSVRVFSSLMDAMTDEELLGVIGHEIGHVAHKDSKKGFRRALLTSALKDGIASTNGTAAALSESQLGSLGEALVNATYSQKQESKADAYGFDFLKKNGKNPWAMALAFEKLKKMEEDAGVQKDSKWKRMFSSHPDLDKRIKTMSKRAEKDGFARPENKMPEKIVQIEPSTQQVSNNQTTTRKSYNNKAVSGKPAGKRPTAKRPVSKRPAARKR
ncbi:M48 family metallopeptidase [Prevotella scopos JCM 17725]|jgi:putative Zn-dependent protease with chaperone function|uniref:Metalloprotease n=1 Tax=Prevotella scopos JCM 17725 TaxID=1236518 RepID=A0AAX2F3D6_9BACT|nr:M48 family metallopeptidase [Prevotella scopos]ANR72458.1 peptidase [Prevotella scopos JCM 17725]QUB45330.1 M48 family metallopeptidase [Prevotella scopos JCM 17725]SHF80287.1 putative metalloprotease [Prevotella scopos JCM 17725]